MKALGLIGMVILLGGCDGSNPFGGGTPVGQVCINDQRGPTFDPSIHCKKGDIIYGIKVLEYCDFNYQILEGACVYVGEKRKERQKKQGN